MTEGEKTRLIAWGRELRRVHDTMREALELTRDAASGEDPTASLRDLLLYCRGFCTALTAHHEGEGRILFPAIAEQHPELRETLGRLSQDHSMLAHLLTGMERAVARSAGREELHRHLEGIAAIMESHFRYEERALMTVLEHLDLHGEVEAVLGPL